MKVLHELCERMSLLGTSLAFTLYSLCEERKVRIKYYGNSSLRKCDLALKTAYQAKNPYQISRDFLSSKGAHEIHNYGETPLTSLEKIFKHIPLQKESVILDLGCGRGRGVFFLYHWLGCRVKGIDWVPHFIDKAQHIADAENCNIELICGNMLQYFPFSDTNVIYLAWTCMEENERLQLEKALETTNPNTLILTVSYPLESKKFNIDKTLLVSFPWGKSKVFFQKRVTD